MQMFAGSSTFHHLRGWSPLIFLVLLFSPACACLQVLLRDSPSSLNATSAGRRALGGGRVSSGVLIFQVASDTMTGTGSRQHADTKALGVESKAPGSKSSGA